MITKVNELEHIHSKESLFQTLESVQQNVTDFFTSLPPENFHQRALPDSWSFAENLDHLIKSVKPLARAMSLPKVSLRLMFGAPKQSSRQYTEIKEAYVKELARGAQASGRYLPNKAKVNSNPEAAQGQLLEEWKQAARALLEVIKSWGDSDLDQYLLPHPILGSLTIREMLFFTVYHDIRHISPGGD